LEGVESRNLSSSSKGNILLFPSWQREESRICLGTREYMGSQRDCTEKTWGLEVALRFGRGLIGNPGYVFQNKPYHPLEEGGIQKCPSFGIHDSKIEGGSGPLERCSRRRIVTVFLEVGLQEVVLAPRDRTGGGRKEGLDSQSPSGEFSRFRWTFIPWKPFHGKRQLVHTT
jgi:hypothetical protein